MHEQQLLEDWVFVVSAGEANQGTGSAVVESE